MIKSREVLPRITATLVTGDGKSRVSENDRSISLTHKITAKCVTLFLSWIDRIAHGEDLQYLQ